MKIGQINQIKYEINKGLYLDWFEKFRNTKENQNKYIKKLRANFYLETLETVLTAYFEGHITEQEFRDIKAILEQEFLDQCFYR